MANTGTDNTSRDMAVKVGNPVVYNIPSPASYSGNATYTAADIIGTLIVHNTSGGAVTGTLPFPAALANQFDTPRVGDSIGCTIINGGSAGAITLTAVTGVSFDTNQTAGSQIIATLSSKYVIIRFTNVTPGSMAYTVYS